MLKKAVFENTADKTAEEKMYVECWGETYEVELETTSYADNGTLAIQMLSEKEPFAVITLNLNSPLQDKTHAFLDTNNCPWAEAFVDKYGLTTFTGAYGESGFCTYPLYQFNLDALNKGRK